MAYSRDVPKMAMIDYHGLNIMDYHGLSWNIMDYSKLF